VAAANFCNPGGATSDNKAYPLRSRKDSLGLRHIAAKRSPQRRVSKALSETAINFSPPSMAGVMEI
jgi:hypothetical protein